MVFAFSGQSCVTRVRRPYSQKRLGRHRGFVGRACRQYGGQPQDEDRDLHWAIFSARRHRCGDDVWRADVVCRTRLGWGLLTNRILGGMLGGAKKRRSE